MQFIFLIFGRVRCSLGWHDLRSVPEDFKDFSLARHRWVCARPGCQAQSEVLPYNADRPPTRLK